VNFIRYGWAVHHDAAGSYVIERETDARPVVFGPMPAEVVPAFLAERKRLALHIVGRAIKELNDGLERNLPGDPARP
jgi:hypothetical protein